MPWAVLRRAAALASTARALLAALPVTVVLALFSAGCAPNRGIEVQTPNGRVRIEKSEALRLHLSSEPPSLDFQLMHDSLSAEIVANLMDALVEYDFSGSEIALKPGLALSWTPRARARKWRIVLRSGVKWTDGAEFVAQQVIDGWRRLLEPKTAASYVSFLYPIKNARAFAQGKIKDFSRVGARATGLHEIEVELERPASFFPQVLTHHSTLPVRLDVIAKHGDRWTEPGNIQTLGPYKLLAWEHDKLLALQRNESYWGEKAATKFVVSRIINEPSTALNLFQAGQIDALNVLPSTEIRALSKLRGYRAVGGMFTFFYGFNARKKPLDDVNVRRALVRAVDRRQVVTVLAGGQSPVGSVLPPTILGFDGSIGLKFDPLEAKRLLAKAGYPDAAKFPRLTLKTNANEDHQRIAENVQAQLRANLGIDVEIQSEDWKAFLAGLRAAAPPMFRWGWLADYPDPDNFLNLMTSGSENNQMGWKNAAYDALVERGASETDPAARRKIYADAQRILVEDQAAVLPLYAGMTFYLIGDRVENYPVNPLKRFRYDRTRLSAN